MSRPFLSPAASNPYPLVAVVGPTGAGKSELALNLACQFGGEIVNCDSVQVYERLDIGSAKTPLQQRRGIKHHLLDVIPLTGELTAGEYARMAEPVLNGIRTRDCLPIIAGGTGFYLRALIDGLSPAPRRNEQLRSRLSEIASHKPGVLHRFLRTRDAVAAARIHPNDGQKLIRGIELIGRGVAPRQPLLGYRVLTLGLNPPRAELNEKLNRRAQWMFENGLLEETREILDSGIPPSAKALATLGYRQAVGVLTQRVAVNEAIAECQLRTRHYAKRQMTWFRREPGVRWLAGFGGEADIYEQAAAAVGAFLG